LAPFFRGNHRALPEDFFHGSATEQAIDIVTIPTDFQHFLSAAIRDEQFGPPTEPWNHKLKGLVAAQGEGINTDASLADAHLFDIAPTVLLESLLPRKWIIN
jgi:hypothetical protein